MYNPIGYANTTTVCLEAWLRHHNGYVSTMWSRRPAAKRRCVTKKKSSWKPQWTCLPLRWSGRDTQSDRSWRTKNNAGFVEYREGSCRERRPGTGGQSLYNPVRRMWESCNRNQPGFQLASTSLENIVASPGWRFRDSSRCRFLMLITQFLSRF